MLHLFYQKNPSNVSKSPLMETIRRTSRQISITVRTMMTVCKLNRTGGRWWRLANGTHIFIATEHSRRPRGPWNAASTRTISQVQRSSTGIGMFANTFPFNRPGAAGTTKQRRRRWRELNVRKVQFNEQILIRSQNIPWLKSSCPRLSLFSADTDLSLGFNCIWVKWILRCWINQ